MTAKLIIAGLLAQDDRVDEAVTCLRRLSGTRAASEHAGLLIRQRCYAEAIAVVPGVAAQREEE